MMGALNLLRMILVLLACGSLWENPAVAKVSSALSSLHSIIQATALPVIGWA